MFSTMAKRIFGTKNDRDIKKLQPIVDRINSLESSVSKWTDEQFKSKTDEFRQILRAISTPQGKKEKLDELLPEAFAVCREAGKRVLNMRHFDVQLIGGIILHQGKIAEMRTGEGKTLVATLPVYLNALLGRGVHVVTVNDYLARRDAEWMGKIYNFLGLTVGVVVHDMPDTERKQAYLADVTYGQNNEFGFDYLRDNMKYRLEDYVQRDLFFAIVDEVDSILIDEARTPLIISGPTEESTDKYYIINQIIPSLKIEEHYTIDEKAKSATLTEDGISKVEKLLNIPNLYDPSQLETVHHVSQALRAHAMYHVDVDYVVKDGQILIVDEFTGRLMPGRRWSDGLHQAIEAKENVKIENENQTLASITFQNYFRMFDKLAGMTGTAETEAEEFHAIYKLEVSTIPTNKPMLREDFPDVIYRTEKEKFEAISQEIKELHEKGQPVLVGTVSIERSERLSKYLKRIGVPHNVLNAKQHEREAEIVKDAGQRGQVTIATNMAGRGTDIVLGEGVKDLGGLFILGTERHEARRIDNQLRGRSGRQGDPGASRFYLSLEDDLMRIFASDRVQKILDWAGMKEGEAIEHTMTSRAIESAQRRVEGHNFDIRKHLLKYDDVMNQQRKVIYALRKSVLGQEDIQALMNQDIEEISEAFVLGTTKSGRSPTEWDWKSLQDEFKRVFATDLQVNEENLSPRTQEGLYDVLLKESFKAYQGKEADLGSDIARMLEREIKLRTIDTLWKDHLLNMDHLKESVGFEGYAQKDPLVVYRKKAFELFDEMIYTMKENTIQRFLRVQLAPENPAATENFMQSRRQQRMQLSRGETDKKESKKEPSAAPAPNQPIVTVRRNTEKVGRNDPCPCGSGKKFKLCHGNA